MAKNNQDSIVKKEAIQFLKPSELLEYENSNQKLDTGSAHLNSLIGGGIEFGAITEAYGSFNTGKTQLALTLAVNLVALNKKYETLFIDTESSFRANRVQSIAQEKKADSRKVLESIKLARTLSTKDQVDTIKKLDTILQENPNIKLIIVDSIIANLRAEFTLRESLPERQKLLSEMLYKLREAAEKHNVAIYITNQISTDPSIYFGDPNQATGGNVLAHFSQTRLYFRQGKKGTMVAKLTDSSCLPPGECPFIITTKGVSD